MESLENAHARRRPDAVRRVEPRRVEGRSMMPQSILYPQLAELLDRGAQLVEVLPAEEYAEEHLPDAINIPLKQLDAETTVQLDKRRAVFVYCWDAL
jgi:rhodanese-related sulfurtransferase